jgi:hypothetical protein
VADGPRGSDPWHLQRLKPGVVKDRKAETSSLKYWKQQHLNFSAAMLEETGKVRRKYIRYKTKQSDVLISREY